MSLAAIWWSLVEIVRNGPKSVLENATHILKLCIEENQHDSNITKIKSNLWEFLPDTLTAYLEDEQSKDGILHIYTTAKLNHIVNKFMYYFR